MKKAKKTIILLLVLILVVSVISCGPNKDEGFSHDEGGSSQEQGDKRKDDNDKKDITELKMLIVAGNDEMPGWNGIVDSFNKNNGDVKIKLEQLPGGWDEYIQKLTALIAAGSPPDIGRMGVAFMPQFISKGQVEDLSNFVDKDINMDDYYEIAFEQLKKDGKIFGIPIGIYTMGLYYNKTMFDEAGVEYPPTDWDNPWTIEEFREAAKKLTKGEGPNKQYGYLVQLHPERSIPFIWGNGGNFLNEDKSECVLNEQAGKDAYKLFQDMLFVDKSAPTPAQLKAMPADQMFMSNKLAMMVEGQWMMPAFAKSKDLKFGVAAIPKGSDSAITVNYIDQYVIFKGSKHVDEAWEAVKSFIGEDAENIMVDNKLAGIPVLKSVADARKADLFNPLDAEEKEVWFKSVDNSKEVPFTENWAEIMDKTMKKLDLVGLNQLEAEQACDEIKVDVDGLLKK